MIVNCFNKVSAVIESNNIYNEEYHYLYIGTYSRRSLYTFENTECFTPIRTRIFIYNSTNNDYILTEFSLIMKTSLTRSKNIHQHSAIRCIEKLNREKKKRR